MSVLLSCGLGREILGGCGSCGEIIFERFGLDNAEVITGADDVCAVIVRIRVQSCEERKHFRTVSTAAEDDEKMGRGATSAGMRTSRIGSGEDIEEAELV